MPRTKKKIGVDASLPEIPSDLLDQLVTGPMTAESVDAVMRKFKKAILERALGAEMTHHLGYAPGDDKPAGTANHR
jgi:putative transposase